MPLLSEEHEVFEMLSGANLRLKQERIPQAYVEEKVGGLGFTA